MSGLLLGEERFGGICGEYQPASDIEAVRFVARWRPRSTEGWK